MLLSPPSLPHCASHRSEQRVLFGSEALVFATTLARFAERVSLL